MLEELKSFIWISLTETGSEDDGLLEPSEDDFFLTGSSSDEADADDEWTDKSTRYVLFFLFFNFKLVVQFKSCVNWKYLYISFKKKSESVES